MHGHGSAFVGGTPIDEAKSLLRPCLPHGQYGQTLKVLPQFLAQNLGTAVGISQALLAKYLRESSIRDTDLGGPLGSTLPMARYFVIHDTSYKIGDLIPGHSFSDDINTTGWIHNRRSHLNTLKNAQKKDAHVFVSRVGDSVTVLDFAVAWSATKYTNQPARGLKIKFCHVEMIQPRLGTPHKVKSDWFAPTPGFTGPQLDRLALIYIVASFRHGEWLIPAYHHNVDMEFGDSDAHDDPQNFDLQDWGSRITETLKDILGVPRHGDFPTIPRQSG